MAKNLSAVASVFERETPDVIVLGLDLSEGNEALGLATVLEATGPLPIVFVAKRIDPLERDQIRALEGTPFSDSRFSSEERTMVSGVRIS